MLAAVALAGGCGGDDQSTEPPPGIAPAAAERLAATSDEIADLLDRGDVCGAAHVADRLRAQVTQAVNARAVPARFQEELSAKANELVDAVNCPPPPPQDGEADAEEDDEEREGKGKGKDNKKQDGEAGAENDPGLTIEVPPVPTSPEDE